MTNRAVLAGSILAGAALWAAVYAVPWASRGPAQSGTHAVSATEGEPLLDLTEEPPAPRRWADLPRAAAKPSSALPPDPGLLSEAAAPEAGGQPPRRSLRHGRRRIQAVAWPDIPLAHRITRQRADQPRAFRTRRRGRHIQEPIQFSLATRSSS